MSNLSNIDFENLTREDLISILECKKGDILKMFSFQLQKYVEMIVDTVHSSKAQMTLMQ